MYNPAAGLGPARENISVDYSQPWATALRKYARILKPAISLWRRSTGNQYEDAFGRALLGAVKPGDCVWDIGANVGNYTKKFAQIVGNQGHVIAFEPSPQVVHTLTAATQTLPQVSIQAVGLSNEAGEVPFFYDPNGIGTLDSLTRPTDGGIETKVQIRRGDDYLDQHRPNIIKIDVEGFEKEVLTGMPRTLASPSLRSIFVEVHFQLLERKGTPQAPSDIAAMLKSAGFKVKWTDASHIAASRV